MERNAFRLAVEAHDLDGMIATLADDVVFHSPAVFTPYEGKSAVAGLFAILVDIFEDFHYIDELQSEDGGLGLRFRAHIGDLQIEGIDLIEFNEQNLIQTFTVMIRPRSALEGLQAAVQAKLSSLASHQT